MKPSIPPEHLVIRTDGGRHSGLGHVMRCLALAQGWGDTGRQATFVMAHSSSFLQSRLEAEGVAATYISALPGSVGDARQTVAMAQQLGASWIIVDAYGFDAEYQKRLKHAGFRLLLLDDTAAAGHYYADMVLNQNLHAHADMYPHRESDTRLLLGARYVLLRRHFIKWHAWRRQIAAVGRHLLITLGGSDPPNVTRNVIRAVQKIDLRQIEVVAVVGAANAHYDTLLSAIQDTTIPLRLVRDAANMPELMAWADIAVAGGGITSLELAFMRLPGLILVLADNQYPTAAALHTAGVAVNLGRYERLSSDRLGQEISTLLHSPRRRATMARRGAALIDGMGVRRVIDAMLGDALRLRRVGHDDCHLLWSWANDPAVRAQSFSSTPISWAEHVRWLASKLHNPHCRMYVASNGQNQPVGQVRYELDGDDAEISISIDAKYRGRGYGHALIGLSCRSLFDSSSIRTIHAYVKPTNESSTRAFSRAGFKPDGVRKVRECPAIHFILRKDDVHAYPYAD